MSTAVIYCRVSTPGQAEDGLGLEAQLDTCRGIVAEYGFDVAVRIGVLADSTLIARKLAPIRLAVVAHPNFWKHHGRPTGPEDLEQLTCLCYSNLPNFKLISFWTPDGAEGAIAPSIRLLASNGEFIREAALEGLGFTVVPSFIIYEELQSGRLEEVLRDYAWSNMHLFAVYPPTRLLASRVRAFVDALVKSFADNPYWDTGR